MNATNSTDRHWSGPETWPDTDGNYASAVARFDIGAAFGPLHGMPGGGVNAAEICCDRHADDQRKVALRHRASTGRTTEWTFAQLRDRSEKLAGLFASVGVGKGARVAALLPRGPELLITILATWRVGGVYQPLFTAFGPKAIGHRVTEAGTKVIVTDRANRDKISGILNITVVSVGAARDGDHEFWGGIEASRTFAEPVACTPDDPFLIMFTSGTTGPPKPLLVPLRAIAAFARYMLDAVGLRDDDRFWNLADPGWAYGLYYAVIGPLALGRATTFHEGSFTVESTYATIQELGITNLAGSPTAYRRMIVVGADAATPVRGKLRVVSSAGEPLSPAIIRWFADNLQVPIYDHFGQTEIGMVLCNHHAIRHPVRMGSAGFASPGHRVVILSDKSRELGPGEIGTLALDRTMSPLMWFDGYLGRETSSFAGRYYRTGDLGEWNDDGSISFVGRSDDVITTSGYRVGPFDHADGPIQADVLAVEVRVAAHLDAKCANSPSVNTPAGVSRNGLDRFMPDDSRPPTTAHRSARFDRSWCAALPAEQSARPVRSPAPRIARRTCSGPSSRSC